MRPHPKGRTVDVVTTIDAGGEMVWESTSTYLHRGVSTGSTTETGSTAETVQTGPSEIPAGKVVWRLGGDVGRRYAAVSGDHNPIHLYPLTAKALGFRRQIAHGMWSLARCVAAVENRLPDAVTVDAAFRKPIFLPGTVAFGVSRHDEGWPSPSPHRRPARRTSSAAPTTEVLALSGCAARIRPSWATVATRRPSSVNTRASERPRAPLADGDHWS